MGEAGLPGAGPGPWARAAAQGVWLVYLLYPISQFAAHPGPPARVVLGLGLLLVFLAAYGAMWRRPFQLTHAGRLAWAGVLTALSLLAAVLLNLPVALGGLVYVGPVLGFLVDRRLALMGIGVVTAILAAAWRVMPLSPALFWSLVLSFVAVAVAMQIWGGFWRMGMRLRLAEEQLRDMAVLEERLGLSRDLHDVVGHRLSAIAVRAELAAQQARGLAPEGADEMLRVAQMARDALGDVRRMLSRWQAVSLRHEWADARATLEASGIRVVESGMDLEVPVALDRGLGFFVKEGARISCATATPPGADSPWH